MTPFAPQVWRYLMEPVIKPGPYADSLSARFAMYLFGSMAVIMLVAATCLPPPESYYSQATDARTEQMWSDFGKRLWSQRQERPKGRLSEKDVAAMVRIAWLESRFDPECTDPRSSAKGLFGFLDSTAKEYGGRSQDPYVQTRQAVRYVQDRYGTPTRALEFWRSHGWY